MDINKIKENPSNPRTISKAKFELLKKSITDFPEMINLRPLVIDKERVVLGGNMRLRALKALGYTKVPVIKAESLTEAQRKEFVIKDNASFGEWDVDMLANEWADLPLADWGLDIPKEPKDIAKDENWEPKFKIIIEFESEKAQLNALTELEKKGYTCQLLML